MVHEIIPLQLGRDFIPNKSPINNQGPFLTFRACNLKRNGRKPGGRWMIQKFEIWRKRWERWGKTMKKYMEKLTTMGFLWNLSLRLLLFIISSDSIFFMSVGFVWRFVKLKKFGKWGSWMINHWLQTSFPFIYFHLTQGFYSKWNDQWSKSVHLSGFNHFHLNTKFSGRFEAQQRRRRNHGHHQGLSLWLREEEMLEKIHAGKLCNYIQQLGVNWTSLTFCLKQQKSNLLNCFVDEEA